jgi:hypothetical protein
MKLQYESCCIFGITNRRGVLILVIMKLQYEFVDFTVSATIMPVLILVIMKLQYECFDPNILPDGMWVLCSNSCYNETTIRIGQNFPVFS